jgi:hypothetical protein
VIVAFANRLALFLIPSRPVFISVEFAPFPTRVVLARPILTHPLALAFQRAKVTVSSVLRDFITPPFALVATDGAFNGYMVAAIPVGIIRFCHVL